MDARIRAGAPWLDQRPQGDIRMELLQEVLIDAIVIAIVACALDHTIHPPDTRSDFWLISVLCSMVLVVFALWSRRAHPELPQEEHKEGENL